MYYDRGILITERTDLTGNKLVAYLNGEALTVVYYLHNGEIAEKEFEPAMLKEGLYRMAKICSWMYALVYTSEQRIIFLDEGKMPQLLNCKE